MSVQRKTQKKRLSQEQVRVLEASFAAGKKLEPDRKQQLARELGVPPRQIAVWYQNKRARWKSQGLQFDCGALRLRLEAAIADRKRLERQVECMRLELRRAQDALFGFRGDDPACAVAPFLNDDLGCSGNWTNALYGYDCLMKRAPNHGQIPSGDRDFFLAYKFESL